MNNQVPWKKLGRYISGECTSHEEQEMQDWIKANPERAQLVEQLKVIWKESKKDHDWDIDDAWSKVSGKMTERDRQSPLRLLKLPADQVRRKNIRSRKRKWALGLQVAAYAAVAAVTLIVALLYYPIMEQESGNQLAMQEVVAEKGQRSQFRLSDGTQVWLNADSRLKIPARFTSGTREVFLEGEAFFKVTPNPDKPFVVHTKGSITKVLGTQFNVRAYPGEEEIRVVVEEGKVAFGASLETIGRAPKLIHNQMGVLSENHQTVIRDIENLEQYTGWRKGKLVFRDTPLVEAIVRLERWYDITCIIADQELKDRTITASFEGEPMTEVLKVISLSMGMTYHRSRRDITFYSKNEHGNQLINQY